MIGRIRIGSFKFGNVLGTLIAGVLIGQLDIKVDPTVKAVFFSLFLFATGYKVGPQFFRGLKKNALPQVALTVVLCVTSLVTTLVAAKLLGYDTGTAAGLMAGAFTESTVIGTASDTIDRLDLPEAEKTRLKNNIPVAYAVSYLVGTGFVVWFLSVAAPRLLRVDMKAESRKLAAQMSSGGGASDEDVHLAYKEWSIRAYRLADAAAGRTVADLERAASPERVFVERIRRGAELLDATPATVLQSGDVVAIGARRRVLLSGSLPLGEEVEDPELLDFPMATLDVVVTKREAAEQPLSVLAAAARARRRPRQIDPRRRGNSLRCRDDHQSRATCFAWPAPSGTWSASDGSWATSSVPRVNRTSCSSAWALSSAVSSGC